MMILGNFGYDTHTTPETIIITLIGCITIIILDDFDFLI